MPTFHETPPSSPIAKHSGAITNKGSTYTDRAITPPVTPESSPASKPSTTSEPNSDPLCLTKEEEGELVLEEEVGEGRWSKVVRASNGSVQRAVKYPNKRMARKVLLHEARLLTFIRSKAGSTEFVVPFHGYAQGLEAVVLDYVPMSLERAIEAGGPLGADTRCYEDLLQLSRQLVAGLDFLQSHGIIHGDIKPGNVLIQDTGNESRALYCDFSASRLNNATSVAPDSAGTYDYMAPELFSASSRSTFESDVYALGMTVLCTAIGASPYDGLGNQYLKRAMIMRGEPLEVMQSSSDSAAKTAKSLNLEPLIHGAVRPKPANRWTVSDWTKALGC